VHVLKESVFQLLFGSVGSLSDIHLFRELVLVVIVQIFIRSLWKLLLVSGQTRAHARILSLLGIFVRSYLSLSLGRTFLSVVEVARFRGRSFGMHWLDCSCA